MSLKSFTRFLFVFGALAVVPLALSACGTTDDGVVVNDAPPLPQVEYIPAVPSPEAEIWRPGYWAINADHTFTWVPGEIIPRPSRTAVWDAARWVHHTYGWTFQQGHWE
ncbi:MAG: hypothetical protein P4M13_06825 [Alphaproteobacteria bacterium]|nr:hypothetical protein [Alphaproteobacteria bacterium]